MESDRSMPAISVIMPVYNAGDYLHAAIESILSQSFRDYEFLIFDDGSEDESLSVIEGYAKTDDRIRVFRRAHGGHTALLNEGIDVCRSSYIARMDADDISLPGRFKSQYEFMEAHPEVVALGTNAVIIDPEGMPVGEVKSPGTHSDIDTFHMNGRGGGIVHPSVMMRTEALRSIGGYRTELEPAEDLDLFLRLAEVGKLENLSKTLLQYRHHFDRVTDRRRAEQMKMANVVLKEMAVRRGLKMDTEALVAPAILISPAERRIHWINMAIDYGHYKTAQKHAKVLLEESMFSRTYWSLFLRAYLSPFFRN